MLRPQDTPTRERKNLDGLWQFQLDADDAGRDGRWFSDGLHSMHYPEEELLRSTSTLKELYRKHGI